MKKNTLWSLLAVLILATGCSTLFPTAPTPTPTSLPPTETPVPPTATVTPVPTQTPEPTDADPMETGDTRLYVYYGGFSFDPPFFYPPTVIGQLAYLSSMEHEEIFILLGQSREENADDLSQANTILQKGFPAIGAKPLTGSPQAAQVGGVSGGTWAFECQEGKDPCEGDFVLIPFSTGWDFAAIRLRKTADSMEELKITSKIAFENVLETVRFMTEEEATAAKCDVSTDPTYGYSKDNPIRVGGNALAGPYRERAYLDSISGPGGEELHYSREGSGDYGNTILDTYSITYTGHPSPIILYIDEYSFSGPFAPQGFGCYHPFPLKKP